MEDGELTRYTGNYDQFMEMYEKVIEYSNEKQC